MILRLFYRTRLQFIKVGETEESKQHLNLSVTISHIVIIICFTIASIFAYNVSKTNGKDGNYVAA